jgi:hypothetical protein
MARRWDRAEAEADKALQRLSPAQSIAIGEALLVSDVMRIAHLVSGPRPPSIAVALGLKRAKHR